MSPGTSCHTTEQVSQVARVQLSAAVLGWLVLWCVVLPVLCAT
jgi:hypothetical protein